MKNYLTLMRVKHYIKNFLIFLPVVFSGNLLNFSSIVPVLLGFVSFSLISSAVYILNDIADIDRDRNHPKKKERPIAKGTVSVRNACILAVICIICSVVIQILTGDIISIFYLVAYVAINILYSCFLKNKPIIDILILVFGFFVRVAYGAALCKVEISGWLYLTVITGSFYMALGKRRGEIDQTEGNTRDVLKFYSREFLDKNMYMFIGMTNAFYALWAMNMGKYMLPTVIIVFLVSLKYSYNIEKDFQWNDGIAGNPVDIILEDKMIICLAAIYAIYIFVYMYIL